MGRGRAGTTRESTERNTAMESARIRYFRPAGLSGVELLSCRDAGFAFPHHFHPAYCIWLNVHGGEHYSHRGNTDILQPGEFGIVAPGEVHANRAIDHTRRSLMTFYVQPERLQQIAAQLGGTSAAGEFRSRFYRDPECLHLLVRLYDCLRHASSVLEKESAFLEVFSLLVRRHAVRSAQEVPVGTEKDRVRRVIEILHERRAQNISLEELARELACTPYHLIRFFKKATGLPPHAYLLHLRLEQARELIRQGSPLAAAALEAGFADQSHLSRHFKALYGITPGAYQRQSLAP